MGEDDATFAPTETLPWVIEQWAATDPDRPYLHHVDGGSRTYAEFHDATLRWADAFRGVGVVAGDNVPVISPTTIRAQEHWHGLGWLRARYTGVNTDLRGSSLAYVIQNSRARHVVSASPFLDRIAEIADDLARVELVIVSDDVDPPADFPFPVVSAHDLWDGASCDRGMRAPQRHEIACISYTSGTTGAPKGVLVPWGRLWPNHGWAGLTGTDVYYCPFPVFHMSGMLPLAWLGFPGGQVVLRDSFKTKEFWNDVRTYGCTTTALIPAMMNWLLDQPPRDDDLDNPLRFVNGAPVVPRVDEFRRRFGVQMRTQFGGTETGTALVAGPDVTADRESQGKTVAPGYEVRIVDEHDYDVRDGEAGELVVRPSNRGACSPATSICRAKPLRRGGTAGSTPATASCANAGAVTSSIASRTRCAVAARTSRRARSRATSTSIRRSPNPRQSECRPSTVRTK